MGTRWLIHKRNNRQSKTESKLVARWRDEGERGHEGWASGVNSLALNSRCAMLTGIMHPGAFRLACRMTTLDSRTSPPDRCPRGLQKSFRSEGGFGTFHGVLGIFASTVQQPARRRPV